MTDKKILVTGAGGPAGISVIRYLQGKGVPTVGVDVNRYGAGLYLANDSQVVPPYSSDNYAETLVEIAQKFGANGVISTMTEEMAVLSPRTEVFDQAGLANWLPPTDTVIACMDKVKFAEVTEAADQPVPLTGWGNLGDALKKVPGPWIVKPRFGRGSRGIYPADTAAEVARHWDEVEDPIVQTRLAGKEFTFDVLADREGKLVGGVPRFRLETKAGISTTGIAFDAPSLFGLTQGLLSALGHRGPANVQGFIDGDRVAFTEINPRFSGGLPLSLGAGADMVGQYVNAMYGEPIDPSALEYQPGTVMVRHFDEVFFTDPIEPLPELIPILPEK